MDKIIFFNTLFGFFTVAAWIISTGILYLYVTKKTFSKFITDQFLYFATSVATFSAIGSIIYSEVVGFIPCKFCWYQRYLMYPIALFLIASLFKKSLYKFGFLSLIGLFISLYHIYLQNGGGGGGSCAVDIPCNLHYVCILGFIRIPVMGATGFLTIFISLLYDDSARRQDIE